MILLGDLETNQLEINNNLKIHCIVLMDWETKDISSYDPSSIYAGLLKMYEADKVVFHNWCSFDYQVVKQLYPRFKVKSYDDTLIMSRLFWPNRPAHSIESYGYELGIVKPEHEEWGEFSPEMLHRCTQDVRILDRLYSKCMDEVNKYPGGWDKALELEYNVALTHFKQTQRGVYFDKEVAYKTLASLDNDIEEVANLLLPSLPLRCSKSGEVNKVFLKNGGYQKHVKEYFGL